MNKAGRLIKVKSVLMVVPIYAILANNLPVWGCGLVKKLKPYAEDFSGQGMINI